MEKESLSIGSCKKKKKEKKKEKKGTLLKEQEKTEILFYIEKTEALKFTNQNLTLPSLIQGEEKKLT